MKITKILNILDECSKHYLGSIADTSFNAKVVIFVLDDLFVQRGKPCFIRCEDGLEFIADVLSECGYEFGATLYLAVLGSLWTGGKVAPFNVRLRETTKR